MNRTPIVILFLLLSCVVSFAQSTYNAALMFALILLILVVVLVIFGVAGRLERYLLRWT